MDSKTSEGSGKSSSKAEECTVLRLTLDSYFDTVGRQETMFKRFLMARRHGTVFIHAQVENLRQDFGRLLVALRQSDNMQSRRPGVRQSSPGCNRQRRTGQPVLWSAGSIMGYLGVQGSLLPFAGHGFVDYDLAMQVQLPLVAVIGKYAVTVSLSARKFSACPWKITTRHPSSFALARIVAENSDFMLACHRGDLLAVRDMLDSGSGRPTDITSKSWNPMTVSQHVE